jgi:hypothetical protein
VQPNEIKHLGDVRQPVGRKKKETARRLSAALGERLFRGRYDSALAKIAEDEL